MDSFIKERNEALLSLDKKKIDDCFKKYGVNLPEDDDVYWIGVHKAITGITGVDRKKRLASVKWLTSRNMGHFMSDITAEEKQWILEEVSQTTLKEE